MSMSSEAKTPPTQATGLHYRFLSHTVLYIFQLRNINAEYTEVQDEIGARLYSMRAFEIFLFTLE